MTVSLSASFSHLQSCEHFQYKFSIHHLGLHKHRSWDMQPLNIQDKIKVELFQYFFYLPLLTLLTTSPCSFQLLVSNCSKINVLGLLQWIILCHLSKMKQYWTMLEYWAKHSSEEGYVGIWKWIELVRSILCKIFMLMRYSAFQCAQAFCLTKNIAFRGASGTVSPSDIHNQLEQLLVKFPSISHLLEAVPSFWTSYIGPLYFDIR